MLDNTALSYPAVSAPLLSLSLEDMPHSVEVEQALLATLLCRPSKIPEVSTTLKPEHFANQVHGVIYATALTLDSQGKEASLPAIATYLAQDQAYIEAGGAKYLAELVNGCISVTNAAGYAAQIIDMHQRRELIWAAVRSIEDAARPCLDRSSQEVREALEADLTTLADQSEQRALHSLSDALGSGLTVADRCYKGIGAGITTGLHALDAHTGGLHPSDLIILGGRPGMGKTALAMGWALAAARAGHQVLFCSLEMAADQLGLRVLAAEAGVNSARIRTRLEHADMVAMVEANARLADLPMYIDDTPAMTIAAIRSRALRLHRRRPLGLLIVDYIGLAAPSDSKVGKVYQIEAITQGLKALAKELHIPVVALCQLSRAVESRDDKRPCLSDLRDSGSIEQDADVVMFVYRHEYYLQREEPVSQRAGEKRETYMARCLAWQEAMRANSGRADIILGKNRHGPISSARVGFDASAIRFYSLEGEY